MFANEDAAFAAAEEVYRAYNEESNRARQSASTADPQSFLAGDALDEFIRGRDLLRRNGLRLQGASTVTDFVRESVRLGITAAVVDATVCFDVSKTRLLDSSGQDVTPPNRPDRIAQNVTIRGDVDSLLITDEREGDASKCEGS